MMTELEITMILETPKGVEGREALAGMQQVAGFGVMTGIVGDGGITYHVSQRLT